MSLKGDWGQADFSVEIADEPDERSLGLMNRPEMPQQAGMLFIYERPQSVSFWMRNTLIPLDMIFIDEDGQVQKVHENAVPLDETPIFGGADILAVLEINGGLASKLGIAEGTLVRHQDLPQDSAAWACE
ncbi:DUF192 domain-containing protein [Litoreibacter roseus]|uniref:DUF192 domain-containing protein n=1 Tax=Litoreibacter roseus TaxID=2601869 RepID=A0A6N6JNA1_9RHOB|nr:hypothetical protein KIN_39420 [Litoreibacter roseus]